MTLPTNIQLLLSEATSPLSREEEAMLFRKGDIEALTKAYLPLVVSIAQKMRCLWVEEDELVSEGLVKLVECLRAFDVDRNNGLCAYFTPAVYRHLDQFIQGQAKHSIGRVSGGAVPQAPENEEYDLINALNGLEPLERVLVKYFYGIDREKPMALWELSAHWGHRFSIERLKKTLASAIEKLKNIYIEGMAER